MDATTIKLYFSLFPRAAFRQAKGGIKMHTVLDHNGGIPVFATVTEAKALELPEGAIVVFGKGYIDYSWFRELGAKGVFFVIRLKRNAAYKLWKRRPVTLLFLEGLPLVLGTHPLSYSRKPR